MKKHDLMVKKIFASLSFASLILFATNVIASQQNYSFRTGSSPHGTYLNEGIASLFNDSSLVIGNFNYNPDFDISDNGKYISGISNFYGNVNGFDIISDIGRVDISKTFHFTSDPNENLDYFMMRTTVPEITTNFSWFSIGDYTLKGARLFWIETQLNLPGFLIDKSMPNALSIFPQGTGIFSLDFEKNDGTRENLFFEGIYLTAETSPVPIPGTASLLCSCFAGLAAFGRRKRD